MVYLKEKVILTVFLVVFLGSVVYAADDTIFTGEVTQEALAQQAVQLEALLRQIYASTVVYSATYQIASAIATVFLTGLIVFLLVNKIMKFYTTKLLEKIASLESKVEELSKKRISVKQPSVNKKRR